MQLHCRVTVTVAIVLGLTTGFTVNEGAVQLYENDACVMADGSEGICIISPKCAWFKTEVIQRKIVPYANVKRCGFTIKDEIICCPAKRKAVEECQKLRDSTRLAFHIVGGEEAEEGEVPFIAALGYETDDPNQLDWACGSSLVSPRFLLTAAHCIRKRQPILARMGALNPSKPDTRIAQDLTPKAFHMHPKYKTRSKYNDIGLIEVDGEFKYDDWVSAACLYTDLKDLPAQHTLTAAGWGLTGAHESRSDVLLSVNLTTMPLDRCTEDYASRIGVSITVLADGVINTQYCTIGARIGNTGTLRDACNGDSGGPLYYNDGKKSRFYLVGITSFGMGCGETASIYTRIAAFLDWIEPIVWP